MENTTTCGRYTSVDTALVNGLACYAGMAVDIVVADGSGISVGDPSHLALTSSHVGSRYINARAC